MAITKERLEELIEKGATIYGIDDRWDIAEVRELSANQLYYSSSNDNYQYMFDDCGVIEFFEDELFETKEDAEEYAEFGNITRTERLELPSWEQIKLLPKYTKYYFYGKDNALCGLCISPKDSLTRFDGSTEELESWCGIDVDDNCEIEHFAPLTRENYNEARRICVKLFKGEDTDDKVF